MSSVARIIDTVIGLITLLLTIRLLLEFFGANPRSGFVSWIFALSAQLMGPFAGIFPSWNIAGFVIDIPVVVAMVAYGMLGWALIGALNLFAPPRPDTHAHI